MKIAFIGAGNLASALMGGLIGRGATPHDLLAVDPFESKRQAAAQELRVATAERLASAEGFDTVVLAVKPQMLEKVCADLERGRQRSRRRFVHGRPGTGRGAR